MWELIIAYMVGDTVEKFTRRSTDEHNWTYDGDGFWSFHCTDSTDRWSGTFRNVVWFTETKVSDGEDEDQETTAPVTLGAWATGGSSRRPAYEAEGQHDPTV